MGNENERKMVSSRGRGNSIQRVPQIDGEGPTKIGWADEILQLEAEQGIDPLEMVKRGGEQQYRIPSK